MIPCRVCGHDAPDGSASCPRCGAQLATARHAEERRIVTTLVCDLVGFTALSERHDPEDVNALLRRYYEVARRVVHAYGGTVEKFIGDAVVAVFGVPTLHEDDPERGVRAALRLVDEIDALQGIGGEPVEVRVGVNTGEALVALDVEPSRGEGFLTGDAVNVAARLQAAAPPMAVAVGAATHAATDRIFKFEACHPVVLKGKEAPVAAWIATASLARTGSELRSFTTDFVGRDAELTALNGLLEEAGSGRKVRLGLIVGEPGIGKSRLLAEFARHLDERPELVTWRQGRCLPYGSGITFWPLGEIVKACAGVLDSDGVARTEARLETVLPEGPERDRTRARLRPLLGLEGEEATREENFTVWRGFLEELAAARPTVVVVEDLHWADEGMLAFMDYLTESTAAVPLLVLATSRPEVLQLTGPGAGFVASAERFALGPLSGDETAQLVLARLGAKSLPVTLQATLLERSGGNPLFAEELVRLLEDGDLLITRGGQTILKEGAELPTPESIGALIAARLDLLTPERKALVADAAVVGRTFWAGAVAAVGGLESAAVFEGLHELVAKELVRPARGSSIEGETEFVFVHALVCDVAYSQLTRADRAQKHAALARWLEERTGGRTEDLAEILAYHYGTALEMAGASGLYELEDELGEPTSRYLALAGGRAAPLDTTAAAAHFARAQQVADDAARPKRRWFLSRRTRRTIRRKAPVLAGAAAVLATAVIAALVVWALVPSSAPVATLASAPSPTPTTAAEMATAYAPGVVRITAQVPLAVHGKLAWKRIVSSGFVFGKDGTILTSMAAVDRTYRGPRRAPALVAYTFYWVMVELWDAQGHYHRVRGFFYGLDYNIGEGLIAIDPAGLHLTPLPLANSDLARTGQPTVCLSRQDMEIQTAAGRISDVWRVHDSRTGHMMAVVIRTRAHFYRSGLGGPMLDAKGRVIGIVGPAPSILYREGTRASSQVSGSAVAINNCASGVAWYNKAYYGRTGSAFLGAGPIDIDRKTAAALGYPRAGELVQIPTAGGPAAQAGIRGGTRAVTYRGMHYLVGGDLIVAIDSKPAITYSQQEKLLAHRKPGDHVRVTLLRGNRFRTIRVRLGAFPYVP